MGQHIAKQAVRKVTIYGRFLEYRDQLFLVLFSSLSGFNHLRVANGCTSTGNEDNNNNKRSLEVFHGGGHAVQASGGKCRELFEVENGKKGIMEPWGGRGVLGTAKHSTEAAIVIKFI